MMSQQILEMLTRIEQILTEQTTRLLSFKEACLYSDLSASQMYKLTSKGEIPHFKPNGKKLYFAKSDLDAWLMRNPVRSNAQIEQDAIKHVGNKKARR